MKFPEAKIYGIPKGKKKPVLLSELSFVAGEKDIRAISEFLVGVADAMKKHGSQFGHSHLRDEVPGWSNDATDIIVVRDTAEKEEANQSPQTTRGKAPRV